MNEEKQYTVRVSIDIHLAIDESVLFENLKNSTILIDGIEYKISHVNFEPGRNVHMNVFRVRV